MKVVVVGVGRMGQVHARLLAHASGVSELVVTDADVEQAKTVAQDIGARAVGDAMDAFKSADAVVVATPPATHAMYVKAAVARGCPVLCEKPLADNLTVATELADYVEAAGVLVKVGFHRRFDHGYRAARTAVLESRLGQLYLMRLEVTEPGLPPSPKTNLLRNTAIHDFDAVRWLSGEEVVSVYADGAQRSGQPYDPRLDPDTVVVSLRLTGDILAAITVSRMSPLGYDVRAELVGSRDHVALGWTDRTPIRSVEPNCPAISGGRWRSWQERFEEAYRSQLGEFLGAVTGNAGSGAGVRDAVEAHRIADAARTSLQQELPVTLQR